VVAVETLPSAYTFQMYMADAITINNKKPNLFMVPRMLMTPNAVEFSCKLLSKIFSVKVGLLDLNIAIKNCFTKNTK
jgi:hypothetical protein